MDYEHLDHNASDHLASVTRAFVGMVPLVGAPLTELFQDLIPNQRMDRFKLFLIELGNRTASLDESVLRARFSQPGFVNLAEQAAMDAARSVTQDRIERIALLLTNCLGEDDAIADRQKHMLWLLSQVNDSEMVILARYAQHTHADRAEFEKNHPHVFPRLAGPRSQNEVRDSWALYESYVDHLRVLKLLQSNYETSPTGGEFGSEDFDERRGTLKPRWTGISRLGAMLLRYINAMPDKTP